MTRVDKRGETARAEHQAKEMRAMGALDGRVAVITGAGRGIGREHALLFASEGAKVVVNDLGGAGDGTGADTSAAERVVQEILAAGGDAIANGDDVADFDAAGQLIRSAVERYGRLDVLVNNAGILRDRFLINMSEAEWDAVIRVHLKGHFGPLRHAAEHWRARSKAGESLDAAVINTASPVGLTLANPGQTNYAAAKAGIAALTCVAAAELARYGVRVNCVAPGARTRLTLATPGLEEMLAEPQDSGAFDAMDPANVAPLVAYLATTDCPLTGEVFAVQGGVVERLAGAVEFVLNTPSHHRGHHGSNEIYLDKNYGGITILWDRLFRTFQPETERVRYGLTTNIDTYNPIKVATHEFAAMIEDVRNAESWSDRIGFVLRGPGWAYDRRAALAVSEAA
jgi:NAD(P)-dependent dehydrogenase (short-subunit alcohol dehydrogenase family)